MAVNPNEADYFKAAEPFGSVLAKVDNTESDIYKAGEPFGYIVIASLTQTLSPSSISSTVSFGSPRIMFPTQTISPSSLVNGGTGIISSGSNVIFLEEGRFAIKKDENFYIRL